MEHEWTFKAHPIHVVDGDTVDLRVDLGFRTYKKIRVRLGGVDTNEIYGVEDDTQEYMTGVEQKEFVERKLFAESERGEVIFNSQDEKGKYGRWVGDIFINDESLTESLVDEWPEVEE
jgi:Micrococcal nuclease (thermonuclease) homologs